jgi:hypothetical protein
MTTDVKDLVDGAALRSIAALADPVGVLTVYVTADPREGSATRPAWQVRITNELGALERRLRKDGDTARADLLAHRLADVDRELQALVDPSTPGQGRALFVALSGGTISTIAVQVPLGDSVELGRSAYVRPLLAALSSYPPAGVAAVSGHGVHLIDLRMYPELVSVPGVEETALAVEPRLGEQMVEAALRQGSQVTLIDPADTVDLRDAGGVAAILRW